MSKPLKRPSLEKVLKEVAKRPIGPEIWLTVIADFKEVQIKNQKVAQPVIAQFKIEIAQATVDFVLDLIRRIHEDSPVLEIKIANVYQLEQPKEIKKYIEFMKQAMACQACQGSCPSCHPSEGPKK